MRRLLTFLSLTLLLTCAKEDSQAPNTQPSQIVSQYTLTVSAGDGGSVSTTGGSFASGTQVSITATPNAGYSFSGWSNGSTANPLTVTLNSNTTVTANFEVIVNSYTLTVSAGEGGSVSSEGGEYEEGTEVTITATPNEGYRFIGWSDGSSADSLSITVNSDITITANFEQIPTYTLTLIAEGGTVEGEGEYEEGTEVTLTAIANNEYHFTGWSDGETGLTRTVVINNNITLAAYFESNPIYNGFYYDYYELDNPPWSGTIFITGGIIDSTNNNYFIGVEYVNQSRRQMYDRRSGWGYYESYNYNASFTDDISVEIQINPEFDFNETYTLALKYAKLIGQLPTSLKKDLETMWIHKGTNPWGGGNNNILIHTGQTVEYENWYTGNIVEETIIHEAAHTSLDSYIYGTDGWNNAVAADQTFISTYAKDYPNREDVAELLPLYIGVKYFPERLDRETRSKILSCCLNRILFLDSLNLDFRIYED